MESRWNPLTGVALDGPYEGSVLRPATATGQLYWGTWLRFHPDTTGYGTD